MAIESAIAAPPSILIVDDTPTNLHILLNVLEQHGYEVRCVRTGAMALIGIQASAPDLIVLDIRMPDMDGYEICQTLKANAQTSEIPIIFLSALEQPFDKVKAFEVGGADYITKPFQVEEVLVRINHQLTIRNLQQQRKQLIAALEQANLELESLAALDDLTQVANRRRFDNYLELEWQRAAREQLPLSLILADIDYFKRYNDSWGHLAGDRCLQIVAQTIRAIPQRPSDLVARYGGEEFTILLPNTDATGAAQIAETIRQSIEQLRFPHALLEVDQSITLSLGVASLVPVPNSSSIQLIELADQALYNAKAQGRNIVCVKDSIAR